jgi:hypothetical protein
MEASVAEAEPGPSDEIAHGARNDRFTRFSDAGDALGHVHGNATNVIGLQLDLTSVQATADRDTERSHGLGNRWGAPYRASWSIEGGEETRRPNS